MSGLIVEQRFELWWEEYIVGSVGEERGDLVSLRALEKRLADEREQLFSSKNQIKLIEKNIFETEERVSKLKEETENKVFERTGSKIELILG